MLVISPSNEQLVLENTFQATSNDGQENYDLTLTREMKLGQDPLLDEPQFKSLEYEFLGTETVSRFTATWRKACLLLARWNVIPGDWSFHLGARRLFLSKYIFIKLLLRF